jgi:predicted transcriptional regulator
MTEPAADAPGRPLVIMSDVLHVRVPPALSALVDQAAAARSQKPPEWVRQAIRTALQLDGFDPAAIAPRDAGALYDGKRWARIDGGQIKGIGYHDAKPDDGNVWVPVVHEDSEPFDIARHWRLVPHYTLVDVYGTPDRVICTYPVVPKSPEFA